MRPVNKADEPLGTLLDGVLLGVCRDVPGSLGAAVSVADPGPTKNSGRLRVLRTRGVGRIITPITIGELWGPALFAAREEEPAAGEDLWNDPRWPQLTLPRASELVPPEDREALAQVRGAAAVPGIWDETGIVVLSVYLDRPADQAVLATLTRHERMVTSVISIVSIAERNDQEAERMLDLLASRATIEQAKGAVMAVMHCDANEAWAILRRASQQFNIKIRVLATALIEHIGQAPAQQIADPDRQVVVNESARTSAQLIWEALNSPIPHASAQA